MVTQLIVCSLEAWDDVWRRNLFLVDGLLRTRPDLRVLFVEPPRGVFQDLRAGRGVPVPKLRDVLGDGRLTAFSPVRPFPTRLSSDGVLRAQVRTAARRLGLTHPVLWVNDVTYAPLARRRAWPMVYDITDDWLLAPAPAAEVDRLRRLEEVAIADAETVVVCSEQLAQSKGRARAVELIPNAVDVAHLTRPQPRPADLPAAPTAVYVGTLHDARIDLELVAELAAAHPELHIVLVGPDCLSGAGREQLDRHPNVVLLGARPYSAVPAYLQHADVLVVPHRVSAFTDSLDPIKAYECAAVGKPTVATPVAGFRGLGGGISVAGRERFVAEVERTLEHEKPVAAMTEVPTWEMRVDAFGAILDRAAA
jgi:teichuronic acid biosynthesis glycosyltransferase TuaH